MPLLHDDCGAVIVGKNQTEMRDTIQKMTMELETWGQTWGLEFNPTKIDVLQNKISS